MREEGRTGEGDEDVGDWGCGGLVGGLWAREDGDKPSETFVGY